MIYFCSQKNRRALVLQHPTLNGVDYLEVARTGADCGRRLQVTLLKDARSVVLAPSQVQITGGSSSAGQVTVVSVAPGTDAAPKVVIIELDRSGDFSTYTLSLVAQPTTADPPSGFDPQLSTVSFSFKAGCPTVGDCAPDNCCPPDIAPEPDINYLAKDFGGFRQVMLDRMAVLAPSWSETHESDMGIALVEALAYAADHLSYQQDAVGTEAYIGTARSRISMRRHAKLVDYKVDEGSNARVWVYLNTLHDNVLIPSGTLVFPSVPGFPNVVSPGSTQAAALLSGGLGFATMQDVSLAKEQNKMLFYTWSDFDCCLPSGATSATLTGHLTSLQPGSVLVFEEIAGPLTGNPEDANPEHRWAVRLTDIRILDYQGNLLTDVLTGQLVTQIAWAAQDALPFPLCISSTLNQGGETIPVTVSAALGNIVPADHGIWQLQILAGTVALTSGSIYVTGTGTLFTNSLQSGQWVVFASDPTRTPYQVSGIISNSSFTLTWAYAGETAASTTVALIQDLGIVPAAPESPALSSSCSCNSQSTVAGPRPRYFPQLASAPVTFAYPWIAAWSGSVALVQGSATVIGTGTLFTSELSIGQSLVFASDPAQAYQIGEIANDTSLTLTTVFPGASIASTTASLTNLPPASQFLSPPSSGTSRATPEIFVYDDQGQPWAVLDDLLSSNDSQRACVLEIERNGAAFLRFGDGQYGMAPERGMDFQVIYRVGNGSVGNIGRDSLAHIVTDVAGVTAIGNPLAAAGGADPETIRHIAQQAPFAFLTQLRAVTEDDYGVMAEQDPAILEARGTLRWTGSWYTAFTSVDTASESGPAAALLTTTKARLNLLRMMGVDLEVEGAVLVGLRIEIAICVSPSYFQADVETALMQLFIAGNQCTGQSGILNPKNFSFGQTIYTSPIIAAAQGVEGVASATMTKFQRMSDPSSDGVAQGYLTMGRLEIARCDNDPDRVDLGVCVLHMDGGK